MGRAEAAAQGAASRDAMARASRPGVLPCAVLVSGSLQPSKPDDGRVVCVSEGTEGLCPVAAQAGSGEGVRDGGRGLLEDELLFLQGLDYYIWSLAYQKVLRDRLGAPKRSEIVVHYVIGATPEGAIKLSKFAAAQAAALDIPWRLQTVTDWYRGPDEPVRSVSELLPPGKLPP